MGEHDQIAVTYTSATTSLCFCPCGAQFVCDSVEEENLILDDVHGVLRGICRVCGRLETAYFGTFGTIRPAANRIKEYLR